MNLHMRLQKLASMSLRNMAHCHTGCSILRSLLLITSSYYIIVS
uniref:Uncharacterized protein n=1 Tax=Arundo donax TaxID=35708 RepID=A0A0A9G244_ARUDO